MTHVTRAAESGAIDPTRDQSTELAGTVLINPVPSLVLPVPGLVHPHSGSGVEASQVAGGAGLVGNSWASQQLTVDAPVLEVPGGRPRRVGALTIRRFLAPEAIKKVIQDWVDEVKGKGKGSRSSEAGPRGILDDAVWAHLQQEGGSADGPQRKNGVVAGGPGRPTDCWHPELGKRWPHQAGHRLAAAIPCLRASLTTTQAYFEGAVHSPGSADVHEGGGGDVLPGEADPRIE